MTDEALGRRLDTFVEFGSDAAAIVARGRGAFDADKTLRLAAEAVMIRLGELVARIDRLDPTWSELHPELRFRDIKNARNLIAHRYDDVIHGILWAAFDRDLPAIVGRVRQLREQT